MTSLLRSALAAGMALGLCLLASPIAAAPAADPLAGLWGGRIAFDDGLKGSLSVTRTVSGWRARIAGAEARAPVRSGEVRFAFGPGKGGFRGELVDHGRAIRGFWLQPTPSDPRIGQGYARPLTLVAAGHGRWRGTVSPLPRRFTVWLKVWRGPDGALVAAFRNPEANSRGGAAQFQATRTGDAVRFFARPDPAQPERVLVATLEHGPERLALTWPDLDRKITLTRLTPAQAAAAFPEPPDAPAYAYRRPPETGDGWSTAAAANVGMDPARLTALVRRLAADDPFAKRPALVHSMLVARHGKLVLEAYFHGFDRDTPHDMRSAGKTFASVMLGALRHEGRPIGPDSRIYSIMAGRGPFANPDPRKAQITLGQLMTHTSGLACDDNDDASPGNEETMQTQAGQPDWWKYTLDLPMAHDPGTRYAYCSANINLVGAALTTTSGEWLPELFDRTVARPLQFQPYAWNLIPNGEGYLGGGAFVRPRDMLKVGQLWLDGGVWHGRRIVDADWVADSTAVHARISPETTGLTPADFANFYGEGEDGWAWHLGRIKLGDGAYRDYAATGNGGQLIVVVPSYDLVVVFTAGNFGQGGIWNRFRDQIVPNEIVAAIVR
ncbi:MAG: serine hydrolase [Proteobacteria bacterium]|nr:serine hydrolase [Pseudomonadota bacterium]